MSVIGDRIRAARKAARWSVADLVAVCNDGLDVRGIVPTAVRRWEAGTHTPSGEQLRVIAWALNAPEKGRPVTVASLRGEVDVMLSEAPIPNYTRSTWPDGEYPNGVCEPRPYLGALLAPGMALAL
jgi:transcriptional regulator with XRE-family HTH domain